MSNKPVIKPFTQEYLEDAAGLFAERVKIEREENPFLPPRFENPETILPELEGLSQTDGVAAIHKNRLVGFMSGMTIESWRGRKSIYVPEWAHAEAGEKRAGVFNSMYERIARDRVAYGYLTHLVGVLAHDKKVIDALFWLGFGMAAVDAMRDLGEVQGPFADVGIRRAGIEDADIVLTLTRGQELYMTASPTFMASDELTSREECIKFLSEDGTAT